MKVLQRHIFLNEMMLWEEYGRLKAPTLNEDMQIVKILQRGSTMQIDPGDESRTPHIILFDLMS